LLANQFVYPLDDRMQIRHDAANPILNVGVAIRRLGWLTGCTWLACFRHRCILRRRTSSSAGAAGEAVNCTKENTKPRSAAATGSAMAMQQTDLMPMPRRSVLLGNLKGETSKGEPERGHC